MDDTTQSPAPQTSTLHFRLGQATPATVDAYAAAFRAVRDNLPLADAAPIVVHLVPENIAAFLRAGRS